MIAAQQENDKDRASHLNADIGGGEDQPAVAKRVRNGGGQDQRQQHAREQHGADKRGLWIKPVREPTGILPAKPDREPENDRLDQAAERKMLQEFMADLGDGKYVNEVEKQFLVGDAGMVPVTLPQERLLLVAHYMYRIRSG